MKEICMVFVRIPLLKLLKLGLTVYQCKKKVITVLVKHWYTMFFARKSAKSLSRKLILFLNHNFLLLKNKQKKGQYQSFFAFSFQKSNWIVKIVFWFTINQGFFVTDSCPGQKRKIKNYICHNKVIPFVNQNIFMLEFSSHPWQLKFTGKIRPAPFRGAKQAKFKVTGKKVKKYKKKLLKNLQRFQHILEFLELLSIFQQFLAVLALFSGFQHSLAILRLFSGFSHFQRLQHYFAVLHFSAVLALCPTKFGMNIWLFEYIPIGCNQGGSWCKLCANVCHWSLGFFRGIH